MLQGMQRNVEITGYEFEYEIVIQTKNDYGWSNNHDLYDRYGRKKF